MITRSYFIRGTRYKGTTPYGPSWTVRSKTSIFPDVVSIVREYVQKVEADFPGQTIMIEEVRRV